VADLRTGARPWPQGFDLATGMTTQVGDDGRRIQARPHLHDRAGKPARSLDEVLSEVLQLTGIERGELARSVRGRDGNPARRFALWALARDTNLTQTQVGAALGMSETHVSHMLRRFGARPKEPMASWMSAWERRRVWEE